MELAKKYRCIKHLRKFEGLLAVCLLLSQGCAHKSILKSPTEVVAPLTLPVVLKLVGEVNRLELTDNCSTTTTDAYEKKDLVHKRVEEVTFRVRTNTTAVAGNGDITQVDQTFYKNGDMDLHSFAYPEMGESLEMKLTPDGKVLHAGNYPANSIFFLPPVPLPDHPVKPGDHWTATNTWISDVGEVPYTVTMNASFVDVKVCGRHMCANVQVTGDVHMAPGLEKKVGFVHKFSGRFLFSPERGLLVWSEFASDEQLREKEDRAVVHSVLRSVLFEPPGYRTEDRGEPSCPFETTAK